jgi:DegV family protein with EDD domain
MTDKQKVAIVTDGACSISPAEGLTYGIHVAPVYVNFGDKTYQAGVNLDNEQFYSLLRSSKQLPSTSQPTARDFVNIYEKVADEVDAIVTVVISHHMSATLESALAAKEQFTRVPVYVVDSLSVSLGLGMIAIEAARAAKEGQSAEQVLKHIENVQSKLQVIFTVATLEYLHKGGRIGGATALLGSVLDIKPVLYIKDGRIEPLERQRTKKQAVERLIQIMEEQIGSSKVHVSVLHCNIPEEAQEFTERIKSKFNCADLMVKDTGPVIGVHAGPGTLGLIYYPD